ncbi:uncharacterized protein STEHIDRAFT_118354, partial [Stereum hirsutum FP-91666 SS1]|uniref:uncharacterized protein n=1 Tax=Stereum hirsutum (strain FP-91666) TaxID=721885 RepID=UPI000440F09F
MPLSSTAARRAEQETAGARSRSFSGSNKSVNGHNEMKQFASRAFEEAWTYSWNTAIILRVPHSFCSADSTPL